MTMQLNVSHFGVIENRATEADAPGVGWPDSRDWFVQWQNGIRADRGDVVVNTQTALSYSVVWRCVNYIAGTIASLCWHVYKEDENERTRLPVHDNVAWTLEMQANPEVSAFEWRQSMLRDALLTGNAVAEIERNGAGKPLWLWRIDPGRVSLERDKRGNLYYRIAGPDGADDVFLDPADVFHLRGLSPDGLVGYSPIAVARRAIELGMHQEQYGVQFFRRGPTPGGFLEVAGAMKEDDRRALSLSFSSRHGGSRNAGSVPVLSGGMTFKSFDMPNKDAEFITSRNLQAEEICRIYGVPQHVAGILTHSTNNNIEHQGIEAVQYCLFPWCRRLEIEADVKLYGRVNRGRVRTKLDLKTLLRGDAVSQSQALSQQVTTGLRTVNEGRAELDLNPIDGGDTPLIQGAMVPLERALEEPPEPAPAPSSTPTQADGNQDAEPNYDAAALAPPFTALLSDAYGRLLRVEKDKATRAANFGKLAEHVTTFYANGHLEHVAETLTPIAAALLLAAGDVGREATAVARAWASDHVDRNVADLAGGVPDWSHRPAEQAKRHLALILEEN